MKFWFKILPVCLIETCMPNFRLCSNFPLNPGSQNPATEEYGTAGHSAVVLFILYHRLYYVSGLDAE